MIRKYIENTEEVRQRLIRMLMDDASDMCRYQRDIYMYIDEDGQARLEWFENPDGNSWIDDDHILLYRCRKHTESIEDSIDGIAMLADILGMEENELIFAVCSSEVIDPDDLDYHDCYMWAMSCYSGTLTSWYDACIEAAVSDFADQADVIMRGENRLRLDEAYRKEEITDLVPVVWLFVLTVDDQFRFEMQQGGDRNG